MLDAATETSYAGWCHRDQLCWMLPQRPAMLDAATEYQQSPYPAYMCEIRFLWIEYNPSRWVYLRLMTSIVFIYNTETNSNRQP